MERDFRFLPQHTLDEITGIVNPILDVIVPIVPYLAVMAFMPGFLRAMLQYKIQADKGSYLDPATETKLRSAPLSVGIWGLVTMHVFFIIVQSFGNTLIVASGTRPVLEVITMAFGFFTLYGLLNVLLRFGLDGAVRRKLGKLGYLDMAIIATVILPALGVGLFAWATISWASEWTAIVGWRVWVDAFTFNFENHASLAQMPVFMKLHLIIVPLAAAHVFYSKLLTHLVMPRASLWRFGPVRDPAPDTDQMTGGEIAAMMYGISAEKKQDH